MNTNTNTIGYEYYCRYPSCMRGQDYDKPRRDWIKKQMAEMYKMYRRAKR